MPKTRTPSEPPADSEPAIDLESLAFVPTWAMGGGAEVRIRDAPAPDGRILAAFSTADYLRVLERSVEKMQIGGNLDYWYRVQKMLPNTMPASEVVTLRSELAPKVVAEGWAYGAFIAFADSNLDRHLPLAAASGTAEHVRRLLRAGAHPNAAYRVRPLHRSVMGFFEEMDGQYYASTPLIRAVQRGDQEITGLLVEDGADPNSTRTAKGTYPKEQLFSFDWGKWSPRESVLSLALSRNQTETARYLLGAGADRESGRALLLDVLAFYGASVDMASGACRVDIGEGKQTPSRDLFCAAEDSGMARLLLDDFGIVLVPAVVPERETLSPQEPLVRYPHSRFQLLSIGEYRSPSAPELWRNEPGAPRPLLANDLQYLGSIENGRYLLVKRSFDTSMSGGDRPGGIHRVSVYTGKDGGIVADRSLSELEPDLVALDAPEFRLNYVSRKLQGSFRYEVGFELVHTPSGRRLELGTAQYDQWHGDDTVIRDYWCTRDGRTWCVSFQTPAFMEGVPGLLGLWVITRYELARLFHEVGSYYDTKEEGSSGRVRSRAFSSWAEELAPPDPLSARSTPIPHIWGGALALAAKSDHSPYDPLFLAAAEREGVKLLVYCRKLRGAFPETTVDPSGFLWEAASSLGRPSRPAWVDTPIRPSDSSSWPQNPRSPGEWGEDIGDLARTELALPKVVVI